MNRLMMKTCTYEDDVLTFEECEMIPSMLYRDPEPSRDLSAASDGQEPRRALQLVHDRSILY